MKTLDEIKKIIHEHDTELTTKYKVKNLKFPLCKRGTKGDFRTEKTVLAL